LPKIQPKGEKIRRAIKWISENRKEDAKKPFPLLIQQVATLYNLSPKDEDFLISFYDEQVKLESKKF